MLYPFNRIFEIIDNVKLPATAPRNLPRNVCALLPVRLKTPALASKSIVNVSELFSVIGEP